jgi:hypothetical protein
MSYFKNIYYKYTIISISISISISTTSLLHIKAKTCWDTFNHLIIAVKYCQSKGSDLFNVELNSTQRKITEHATA